MPLTRHFYELDEVQSALGYCTTRHDAKETLFWCNELILSGCVTEAIQSLFEAWLWQKGPFCLQWVLSAWNTLSKDEIHEKDVLYAAYELTHYASIRDHSLWNLLVLGHQPPSDPLTFKSPCDIHQETPFQDSSSIFFLQALYQGKAHHAWWMAQQLDVTWDLLEWYRIHCIPESFQSSYSTLFEICHSYSNLLGYSTKRYDTIMKCLAVLSCCLSSKQMEQSIGLPVIKAMPDSLTTFLSEKESFIGRKVYRIYSIPVLSLYGTTLRGSMRWTEHTLSHLYEIESHLLGCPFWEEALSPYAQLSSTIQWNSYDAKEEFYRSYFPDDIPDEWSKEDQLKSHGDGILGPTISPSLVQYTQKYLSRISRLIWNSSARVISLLSNMQTNAIHPRDYLIISPIKKEECLDPKHRRFRYRS